MNLKVLFVGFCLCHVAIVAGAATVDLPKAPPAGSAHRFTKIVRLGRVLSSPATPPAGTSRPVNYEVGKLVQLDRDHALLTASLREQGAQDFCVVPDAFVLQDLRDIDPKRAIVINRPDPNYHLRGGGGVGVQAKYPGTAADACTCSRAGAGRSPAQECAPKHHALIIR